MNLLYLTWCARWANNLPIYLFLPLALTASITTILGLFMTFLSLLAFKRIVAVHIFRTEDYDKLRRPKNNSWMFFIFGHLNTVRTARPGQAHLDWIKELGTDVYIYRGAFYSPCLLLADAGAMTYILGQTHAYEYPKPSQTKAFLTELLGEGLLVSEGNVHKRQRKVLQPAFKLAAIRGLIPTFFLHANQVGQALVRIVDATQGSSDLPFLPGQSQPSSRVSERGKPVLDIGFWMSRVTLDIIGHAGFGYHFHSVKSAGGEGNGDEMSTAFFHMMKKGLHFSVVDLIQAVIQTVPGMGWIGRLPTPRRQSILNAHAILRRTSDRIIERKKKEVQEDLELHNLSMRKRKTWAKDDSKAKDLLYLMIKANVAAEVQPGQKLDNAELLGQMTTLLFAGHETISTLVTWLLGIISQPHHMHIQDKIRAEIEDVFHGREELDYDKLMGMPYLDMVVKETLRFQSPVTSTVRTASRDDVIPLSKSYASRYGNETFDKVIVRKGQDIIIPIQQINRLESIWGPTADKFEPERWSQVPRAAKASGMPAQMLSFLQGPRGCIGRTFALVESKVLICALLRVLKFESAGWEVEATQAIVSQPRVVGQEELGTQMPIRISKLY